MALLLPCLAQAQGTRILSRHPYAGSIVMDYQTGEVIQAENADREAYPASIIKLMNLYVIMDHLSLGLLHLDDEIVICREVSRTGGRQVWLAEREVFTLEDLIYAMTVHSANDAAMAVAIHCAGSREAFVELMNQKAEEIGMTSTRFQNVHGLPPGPGRTPDVSTPRDIALMARSILDEYPEIIKYTSTRRREFRDENPVMLTATNRLLGNFEGCDGLKTGFFSAAGFSIVASAQRDGRRLIAVVMGSRENAVRNRETIRLLEKGFQHFDESNR